MSLAEVPQVFAENLYRGKGLQRDDVLSALLERIHLSGSVQFCVMPVGAWQTEANSALGRLVDVGKSALPFHIVAEGDCWLRIGDRQITLAAGDVILFPQGSAHQIGAGVAGRQIAPVDDLPPKPWREIPILQYGQGGPAVRLLCDYLQCDALAFAPLRRALPTLIHARSGVASDGVGLNAIVRQMINEVDHPRAGGISMLRRLTEIAFVEILRQQIFTEQSGAKGWLTALDDPALVRGLSLIHDAPHHEWSLGELASVTGMSRSALAGRFRSIIGIPPLRYVREWRLHLASIELAGTARSIADIGWEAGYASEAAFSRAFARAYNMPPAQWRVRTIG